MDLKQATALLTQKRDELAELFKAHTVTAADGSTTYSFQPDDVAEIEKRTRELETLHDEVKQLSEIERAVKMQAQLEATLDQLGAPRRFAFDTRDDAKDLARRVVSPGRAFVQSDAYGRVKAGAPVNGTFWSDPEYPVQTLFTGSKTVFSTSAGWDPEFLRSDRVELTAERTLVVADLPAIGSTSSDTVAWMEETTKTSAAAETAEGSAYGESAFALTERTVPVSKIGTFIPVTEEQMRDERRVESYINNRLARLVYERLDGQLLTGNGTAPNITGILNKSGIQTQAKGSDSTVVAIFKAITKCRFTGFAEPDAVTLNPNDWQDIRLMQDANGNFIWGPPSESGVSRVWGIPAVITPAITENTGLVGSWRGYTEWVLRNGLEIEVSNSHSDYFIRDQLAIKARIRGAFAIYRPAAFCTVTGI
jgi:hypothetical protein